MEGSWWEGVDAMGTPWVWQKRWQHSSLLVHKAVLLILLEASSTPNSSASHVVTQP